MLHSPYGSSVSIWSRTGLLQLLQDIAQLNYSLLAIAGWFLQIPSFLNWILQQPRVPNGILLSGASLGHVHGILARCAELNQLSSNQAALDLTCSMKDLIQPLWDFHTQAFALATGSATTPQRHPMPSASTAPASLSSGNSSTPPGGPCNEACGIAACTPISPLSSSTSSITNTASSASSKGDLLQLAGNLQLVQYYIVRTASDLHDRILTGSMSMLGNQSFADPQAILQSLTYFALMEKLHSLVANEPFLQSCMQLAARVCKERHAQCYDPQHPNQLQRQMQQAGSQQQQHLFAKLMIPADHEGVQLPPGWEDITPQLTCAKECCADVLNDCLRVITTTNAGPSQAFLHTPQAMQLCIEAVLIMAVSMPKQRSYGPISQFRSLANCVVLYAPHAACRAVLAARGKWLMLAAGEHLQQLQQHEQRRSGADDGVYSALLQAQRQQLPGFGGDALNWRNHVMAYLELLGALSREEEPLGWPPADKPEWMPDTAVPDNSSCTPGEHPRMVEQRAFATVVCRHS